MKQQFNYLFIILILIMTSCNQQNSNEISDRVSEIQQDNIPDKRLLFSNVKVKTEVGKKTVSGATASENVFYQLQELSKEQALDFDVELLPTSDFKKNPWGIVTLSVCNIRGEGSHSAELVTQAVMGTPVKVYKKDEDFYLIQTPDRYFGWVDAAGIALKTTAEMAEWKALEKVLYKQQNGYGYSKPDAESSVETDLVLADLLSVTGFENDFYKIVLADGREAFVKQDECVSLEEWKAKSLLVDTVLESACQFKGVPYLWGGTSAKMVDCSGFVKSAYYFHGVILQRDASQQTFYGELVDTENGYEKLQPGDLVFFGRKAKDGQKEKVTHVGMCMGNQEFIHASGKVRINSLDRNSEKYTEHYEKGFIRARRIAGNITGVGIEWVVDNEFYKEILP